MTEGELKEVVLSVLSQVAPNADIQHLDPDTEFRDQFDFDSVDFLNFANALGKTLKADIPESDCLRLGTLNGCIDYLQEVLPE